MRAPDKPLSPLAAIAALRRNIVEAWDAELFDLPFCKGRWFGQTFVNACDPALMQAVFLDQGTASRSRRRSSACSGLSWAMAC